MPLSYESSGVDYDRLDAFKRACQRAARDTAALLEPHGYREPSGIRGDSSYLIEGPDHYLAHVEEGLGTKNLVADAVEKETGRSYYHGIGLDTVATIVNDLITCGALPISVAMHAAVGDAEWFGRAQRMNDLIEGFAEGCRASGAVWGKGETPTLRGIVEPEAIVLAGSALGRISPKSHRILGDVAEGDAIVFLASSGLQTNGYTLCRQMIAKVPGGWQARLSDGRTFGEALLAPSFIYVDFVRECQRRGLKLKYAAHVTGHGWRKLMRIDAPFVYEIGEPRAAPEVFRFLMESGPIDPREAYGTFNMGVGFAVMVAEDAVPAVLAAAAATKHDAWRAGRVRREGKRKAVTIPSLSLSYEGDSLQVRG